MPGITDPSEEYFKDGVWGWNGSAWRKLPQLWGYSDIYHEIVLKENADAGQNYLKSTAVPTGEVRVISSISTRDRDHAPGNTMIQLVYDTTILLLAQNVALEASVLLEWKGQLIVAEGDAIQVYMASCTALDNLYLYITGYKMTI